MKNTLGITLSYAIQNNPKGIAKAITIGKDYLSSDDICLITGDTIYIYIRGQHNYTTIEGFLGC